MAGPALLRLVRWPGVLTAAADAAAASLLFPCGPLRTAAVTAAAALLYAGGAVLNDAADADRDRSLHPERPLPRGEASRGAALVFGAALLGAGVGAAAFAGENSLRAFAAVAGAVLLYDFVLKRWGAAGVLGMGLCRGGSVLAAALSSPGFGDILREQPGRALLVPLPWFLHGAAVTAASLLEGPPGPAGLPGEAPPGGRDRARRLLPAAAAGILLPVAIAFPLLQVPHEMAAGPAIAAAAILTLFLGRAVGNATTGDGPARAWIVVREGVFAFLLLDAAVLALRGRAVESAAAIALWAAARWLLVRRRS